MISKKIPRYTKPKYSAKKISMNMFFKSYRGIIPDFHSEGFGRLLASGGGSSGCSSTGDTMWCSGI